MSRTASTARRSLNLSIPEDLIEEARRLKLNLSRFLEDKLSETLRAERAKRWQEENKEAIETYNEFLRRNGMWSDGVRKF
ncbi:MAG TPA: type II toxin-antitoxin system CcdA family antitoxin [Solimonas sp.]